VSAHSLLSFQIMGLYVTTSCGVFVCFLSWKMLT